MKLKHYTGREFRSIWDSGPVRVDDQVTCLVGKNEAGKTAPLSAVRAALAAHRAKHALKQEVEPKAEAA